MPNMKTLLHVAIVTGLLVLCTSRAHEIALAQTDKDNRCVNTEITCVGEGCNKRIPAVFGKTYLVPKFKITLIDKNTNKPAARARVLVHYGFKYFEHPYEPSDEYPFGAWIEGKYSTDPCLSNEDGVIETDQFKMEPHGYYKGVYSRGKKPEFTGISVTYELLYVGSTTKHCTTSTDFSRSDLDKCGRNGVCEFTIRDGCPQDWR